jgi:UDP-N-acetylglucosamine 3-dehydrogenase
MDTLRVAVIGVGWFGEIHCNTISAIPGVELAALCELNETRLEEVADKYGVMQTYTDYRELLSDPEIDAVHVVTAGHHHAEPAIAVLEAGKHLFLEKPMAATLEDCQRICEAAKKAAGILMIGHVCRFNPRCVAAKREIEAGKIGKVVALNARRNIPAAWGAELLKKTGPIADTGIHDTDLMLWFTGARAVSAYAQTTRVRELEYPDIAHVMYRFDNGASAIYESAWTMPESAPFVIDESMSIIGTDGFVHIQDTFPNLGVCSPQGFEGPDTTYWPELHGITGGALREELMYFARCVAEGRRPDIITPEEAMEAVRTILAAEQSAATGTVVRLD